MSITAEKFNDLDWAEKETYLEETANIPSDIIEDVMKNGCSICQRTIIEKTEDKELLQRAIELNEEVVSIALIYHDTVTEKQKKSIIEKNPHLQECFDDYLFEKDDHA
jgi:hypothetical protein